MAMRNSTITGLVITLLCASAEAQTNDAYRTAGEICFFSSFLPPAESPVALEALQDPIRDANDRHRFLNSFEMPLAQPGVLIVPGALLKEAYGIEKTNWGWTRDRASERILRTSSDWTNFVSNRNDDAAADTKLTFMVSGVQVLGLERNGYVAGFNLKF